MFREREAAGLYVFPAGRSWERAFHAAVDFLEHTQGLLVRGPAIGDSATEWIAESSLQNAPLRLGAREQDWAKWIESRARTAVLAEGGKFRVLNQARKRDLFRSALKRLITVDGFHHLQEMWEEPRFFEGLLRTVEEARAAGLTNAEAIGRAQETLSTGADAVTREAYQDFWHLLQVYDSLLTNQDFYDAAAATARAAELNATEQATFLLGFDRMSLLEAEMIQAIARVKPVFLPLALEEAEIQAVIKGKDAESSAGALLRGLVTGFSGKIEVVNEQSGSDPAEAAGAASAFLLAGHSPSEEARAAAALGCQAMGEGREVRFVTTPSAFSDQAVHAAFAEELRLPRNFASRSTLEHPIALQFLNVLAIKESGYAFPQGIELSHLLHFSLKKFANIPELAAKAGIRKGLADWTDKAKRSGEAELVEFVEWMRELDELLPERGTPTLFAEILTKVAEKCAVGEYARVAPEQDIEREAHAALASLLRNSKVLAASVEETISFTEWVAEWRALLQTSQAGESLSFFPRLQFYHYGEWLPPATEKTVTIALGWNQGIEPRQSFHFYFEEGARRKLSELLLSSQVQEDLTFLGQMRRLAAGGKTIFSWARHDARGGELQPSWIASALPLEEAAWPEVARISKAQPFQAREKVAVPDPGVESFSASLLERYKECPFRAFAEKVLKLEDRVQPLSLDLSPLEEGNLVHRTLELFYGRHKGKALRTKEERDLLLAKCLEEAVGKLKSEYFKGSEDLKRNHVEKLRRLLSDFLTEDAAYYEMFPRFRDPEVEKAVHGSLGEGLPWKGKVDRVDVDEANRRFIVSDYKLGASTPTSLELNGLERFQLQLYMDAVARDMPGYEPAGGLYVSLKTGKRNQGVVRKEFNQTKKAVDPTEVKYFKFGPTSKALKTDEEFAVLQEDSLAEAKRLALEIQSGKFDVTPFDEETSCKRCEIRPACRIRELRSPPREPWVRRKNDFSRFFHLEAKPPAAHLKKAKGLNPQQQEAVEREGRLVFIEASAGTGKTTVIVEKIRTFLSRQMAAGLPPHKAVEKFAAISFTEKSARELGVRVSQALMSEGGLGLSVAAQALQRISTIHGFCRKVLSDFPLEAGIVPTSRLLDERESEALRQEIFEEFFLHPPEGARAALADLFGVFSRQKIEICLRKILENRLLLAGDLSAYRAWLADEANELGGRVPPGLERDRLRDLLELGEIFGQLYDAAKRERDLLDFNDLEALTLKVLDSEEARKHYRDQLDLLLVDEFQDTNSVQRRIFERLARPGWSNLFVVGDAKQSIYRFRAADVSVFQTLRAEAEKGGNLVTLSRNYRSRAELVDLANRVSRAIFPEAGAAQPYEAVVAMAEAQREAGGKVRAIEYGDPEEKLTAKLRRSAEAGIVAGLVKQQLQAGRAAGAIAILLRKVSGNEAFLQALTRAGVPFRVGSSSGFYSQQVILDSIAFLRVFFGANNDIALLTILRSPWVRMPETKIHEIQGRGDSHDPLWLLLKEEDCPKIFEWKKLASFLSCSDLLVRAYEQYPLDRREHLQTVKLLNIVQGMEAEAITRVEIVERLSNWSGWEKEEESFDDSTMPEPGAGGAVQVMTVHAAKGLEFDLTILPDLTGGLLPDTSALRFLPGEGVALKLEDDEEYEAHKLLGEKNKERELAESKRLLYVALTRAKEETILVLPRAGAKAKKESWAEQIRAADLGNAVQWEAAGETEKESSAPATEEDPMAAIPPEVIPFRLNMSISEISAHQNCAEFHRLKFVQGWDDQVQALWPRPPQKRRKREGTGAEKIRKRSDELLKALGLERKERGIALHRVLERIQNPAHEMEFARAWLTEAYEAQGAKVDNVAFSELLELDHSLLGKFLSSEVGRQLFGPGIEAFPEIPFEWRLGKVFVHGVLDRLIRRPDGSWAVVDYKSTVADGERGARQRFQVASYMAAIAAYAAAKDKKPARVAGFLVDLNEAESTEVIADLTEAEKILSTEMEKIRENYTLADGKTKPGLRGIRGGEQCFSCPYSLHCDLGREIVLEFN